MKNLILGICLVFAVSFGVSTYSFASTTTDITLNEDGGGKKNRKKAKKAKKGECTKSNASCCPNGGGEKASLSGENTGENAGGKSTAPACTGAKAKTCNKPCTGAKKTETPVN